MKARWSRLAATLFVVVAACAGAACRSNIRSYVIHQDVKGWDNYLSSPKYRGSTCRS